MVTIALQNKLLINVTADNVIRLLPPLVINEQQTSEIADRLVKSIKQFTNK
jgi:acetylornithine aminotransferase